MSGDVFSPGPRIWPARRLLGCAGLFCALLQWTLTAGHSVRFENHMAMKTNDSRVNETAARVRPQVGGISVNGLAR